MDCQPSTICLRTAGPFRAALWVPVAWATVSLGLTLSSAFSTEGAAAEVDASREAPWGAASLVRWESLRNGPQCVRGPLPQWDAKHQTHVLTLAPGDAVLFRLPTGSQVRVKAHDGAAQPHEFTATVSNGSGMHKTVPRIDGHGDGEWMFASNEPQHSLCRITLDGAAPCSRRVEIYVSSRDPLRTAEGYATLLPLEGTAIRVTEGTRTRRFWEIAPGEPAGYSVTGPARLRIQSRFVYDIYDRTSRQEYSLYTRCAGELLRVHEGHTTAATRSRLRCSDRPRALGQLETHFLNVGPGTHQLTCDPSARVLLRIEAEDAGAFAANRLNHRITRRDSVDGDFPERSLWDIADGTCAPDVAAPWDSIGLAQQLSMRIARDNRYAQGGLRAAMAIQAVAARNRKEATLQTFARRLLATSTYYRSLIPSDPVTQQRILPAAFLLPRIREPDEDPLEIAMTASWAADLGRQLGQGEFVRAMGNREQPLEYVLPPREGATLLRLAVDRESLSEATRIWLQLGDELQPVDVSPCPELEPNAFVATNATAAWSWRLLNGGAADLPHEAWAEDDAPRPLINAAYAELYVPSHVRTVRLWRESPHGVPPYVAVQVRVHRRFQLNERQYVDALRRACPSPSELWACLLQGAPPPSEGEAAIATERLRNHWEPLRQALEASRAALEATVQPRQRRPRYSGDAEALARSATEAFQRGDWVTAVEAWSPLEPHVDLPNHAEGMLQRAEALRQLDEGGLAETELRGWALHGATPPLRHRAAERLLEWYEQEGDWEQQERLLAYLVLEHPRPDRLAHLCRVWAHQGNWDRVLSVGLTLDDADRPQAALRPAAFHEGWWRTFDDTQRADHDLVVVDAWRRRRDKAWGQTTTDTSFAVPSRDKPALPPSDSVITRQWAEHSGWVAGYGQAVSLSMPSRDWHPRHYVAGPGKPLQLQVPGPIALKLEVRPLHPPPTGTTRGEDAPVETLRDDVLTMTHNGRRGRRVLIRNNRQNPHWKVVGHAELGVGNAISTEIHLGAGWHTLAFEPADGACACRVESRMVSEPPVPMRGWLKKGQEEVPQTPGTQAWRHGRVLRSRRTRVVDPLCASTTYPLMGIPTGSLTAWQTHWERRPQNGHIALPPELPEWLVDAHLAAETTGSHFIADVLRANALSSAPATSSLAREWCRQLLSHGSWEPLEDIGGSAGIHVRALDGWEPESPAMRVRRALMARTDFATTALSASRQFEMRIDLPVEPEYEFALWTPAVGCTPTEPVRIQWQVDGGPLREQTVGAEPLRIPLKWRPGRHTLRLWQADPPQRHYTLLRVGRESDWAEYRPDAESRAQRTYHVARASEPVRFRVEGPAWLRIDEWRPQGTRSRYSTIREAGWHEVELPVAPDAPQTLYRVHTFRHATGAVRATRSARMEPELPLLQTWDWGSDAIRGDRFLSPELSPFFAEEGHVAGGDAYALNGHDATWEMAEHWIRRRALDEGPTRVAVADEFFETRLGYHRHDPWMHQYASHVGSVRARQRGGPSYAWESSYRWTVPGDRFFFPTVIGGGLRREAMDLRLQGNAYLQRPNAPLPGRTTETEWNVGGLLGWTQRWEYNARLSLTPSVTFFARALSRERIGYEPGVVDQDVFTRYKATHRVGARMTQRWSFAPHVDTRWWMSPLVGSNEAELVCPGPLRVPSGTHALTGPLAR